MKEQVNPRALKRFQQDVLRRAKKEFGEDAVLVDVTDATRYRRPFMVPVPHVRKASVEEALAALRAALRNLDTVARECNQVMATLDYVVLNNADRLHPDP